MLVALGHGDAIASVGTLSRFHTTGYEDLGVPVEGEELVVDLDHLVVPRGEVTALVGPNGSGKSTLLRGFSAELEPVAGTVLLDGRAAQERSPKELARELGLLD